MSRLDGITIAQKNAAAPRAVVQDDTVVPHEKPRLDKYAAIDGNGKALSAPPAVRGDYACVNFDSFKGDNASFLNKLAAETIEETSNEKEGARSDE